MIGAIADGTAPADLTVKRLTSRLPAGRTADKNQAVGRSLRPDNKPNASQFLCRSLGLAAGRV
jgi:hypothetical protein